MNYTGMEYEKVQRDETVRKILDAPLLFKPGDRFEYSNAGYSMLAAIIEKVAGRSYEEFLREHLFGPAGMKFTGYRMPPWDKKEVAHWYVGEKGSLFFALYWRDHKNIGVGPLMSMPDFSAPFLSVSESEFAGYHLDMARNIRVSFKMDDKGAVSALTVHSPKGDVLASKI